VRLCEISCCEFCCESGVRLCQISCCEFYRYQDVKDSTLQSFYCKFNTKKYSKSTVKYAVNLQVICCEIYSVTAKKIEGSAEQ